MNMPIVDIKQVEIEHYMWLFKDSFGNVAWDICVSSVDNIYIVGLLNALGKSIRYDDMADENNILEWCKKNHISCTTTTKKFTLGI